MSKKNSPIIMAVEFSTIGDWIQAPDSRGKFSNMPANLSGIVENGAKNRKSPRVSQAK